MEPVIKLEDLIAYVVADSLNDDDPKVVIHHQPNWKLDGPDGVLTTASRILSQNEGAAGVSIHTAILGDYGRLEWDPDSLISVVGFSLPPIPAA